MAEEEEPEYLKETHYVDNNKGCGTICVDLNSAMIKAGFMGEMAPRWRLPSMWGEVDPKKAEEAEDVVDTRLVFGNKLLYQRSLLKEHSLFKDAAIDDKYKQKEKNKLNEPLERMLKHLFYREISLEPETLGNGMAFACDMQDRGEILRTAFSGLKAQRAVCFSPAVCAMYGDERNEFGLVVNIAESCTQYTVVRMM